ncbi:MAG: hypothetical protein ABI977_17625 [Acidobacteriota bacterium]
MGKQTAEGWRRNCAGQAPGGLLFFRLFAIAPARMHDAGDKRDYNASRLPYLLPLTTKSHFGRI